jgi:hypothetical protein
MDTIPYAPTFASASAYASSASYSTSMLMVGTPSNPAYLYPLTLSNYQTWFLDTGTPTVKPDGFEPSSGWVKPLISSTDVPSPINGDKSSGYEFKLYNRTGGALSYDLTYYEVDYYSGLVKFQVGNTPIDGSNGLGFTFNSTSFQASPTKLAYVQSTSTGGPRAVAFKYIGQYLSSFTASGVVSFNNSNTISFAYSGASYSFSIIPGSLTASMLNTGSNGGATAGYVLSNTGDGNFAWIPAGSGTGTSGTSGLTGLSGTDGTSGLSGTDGTSGLSGTDGTSGLSGTDGTSGLSGTDGTSGLSGTDGTSGLSGTDGTSGLSGTDGTSGLSGTDGTSGLSGTDGTSGLSGTDGTSGLSGTDGTSGLSGTDGTSGLSGTDGTSGLSGTDGTSGLSGTDGTSGLSGTDGTSGLSGTDGTSGLSGTDGTSGLSGTDGTSGLSGTDGTSGLSGTDGTSGLSGTDGTSGLSGTDGTSGLSGTDGTSGLSGTDGTSGLSGTDGTSGTGFNTILNPADYRIITSTGSSTNSAVAQPNLTFNPNTGVLSVTGSFVLNTSTTSGLTTGTTNIVSFADSSGNGAYFDYHLSGFSNERRTGTIMSTWYGTSVQFTDTSTPDLNGSTRPIEFNVAIIIGNVTLQSVVTSGTWSVDTGIRII